MRCIPYTHLIESSQPQNEYTNHPKEEIDQRSLSAITSSSIDHCICLLSTPISLDQNHRRDSYPLPHTIHQHMDEPQDQMTRESQIGLSISRTDKAIKLSFFINYFKNMQDEVSP